MTSHAGPAACPGEVCLTCSDEAVPVRVTRLRGDGTALVDTGERTEEVSVALVTARPGDIVLVHAKEAVAVLDVGGPGGTDPGGTNPG
jgi:hydrogenase maturation factor